MESLQSKLGPFPVWVWAALGIGAVLGYWFLTKQGPFAPKSSDSSSAGPGSIFGPGTLGNATGAGFTPPAILGGKQGGGRTISGTPPGGWSGGGGGRKPPGNGRGSNPSPPNPPSPRGGSLLGGSPHVPVYPSASAPVIGEGTQGPGVADPTWPRHSGAGTRWAA